MDSGREDSIPTVLNDSVEVSNDTRSILETQNERRNSMPVRIDYNVEIEKIKNDIEVLLSENAYLKEAIKILTKRLDSFDIEVVENLTRTNENDLNRLKEDLIKKNDELKENQANNKNGKIIIFVSPIFCLICSNNQSIESIKSTIISFSSAISLMEPDVASMISSITTILESKNSIMASIVGLLIYEFCSNIYIYEQKRIYVRNICQSLSSLVGAYIFGKIGCSLGRIVGPKFGVVTCLLGTLSGFTGANNLINSIFLVKNNWKIFCLKDRKFVGN